MVEDHLFATMPPIDGVSDTLWRLSDLLHVPHGAYVNAKMRAQQAAGVPAATHLGNSAL